MNDTTNVSTKTISETELFIKYKSSYIERNEFDQYILFQNSYNLEDLIIELNDKTK